MARKRKQKRPQKRKQSFPRIPRKPAFKVSSALREMSPGDLQEWTGDSTPEHDGFADLVPWPAHDWSKRRSESAEDTSAHEDKHVPTGRSWADFFHQLFVDGEIGILFVIGLVIIFALVLYQDNAAGKWDQFDTILISLRKVGIGAVFLSSLFGLVKLIIWWRR